MISHSLSALRLKLFELIQRKHGFLPLQEYVARYPHTDPTIFSPSSSRIARVMLERWQYIDKSTEGNFVFVKYIGTGWGSEDLKKYMAKELLKVPRGVDASGA